MMAPKVDLMALHNAPEDAQQVAVLPYADDIAALNAAGDVSLDAVPAPPSAPLPASIESVFVAPVAPEVDDVPAEILTPMPDFSAQPLVTPVTPVTPVVTPLPEPAPTTATVEEPAPVVQPPPMPAPVAAVAGNDVVLEQKIIALEADLETLADKNIMLEEQVQQKTLKAEGLERTVQSLEDRLERAERKAKEAIDMLANAQQKKPAVTQAAPKPRANPQAFAAPKAAPKAAPNAAPKSQPKPRAVVKQVQQNPSDVWAMRAASPGMATLANKRTGDLLRVQAGDVLTAIGAVRDIRFDNGRWVVEGSLGSLIR